MAMLRRRVTAIMAQFDEIPLPEAVTQNGSREDNMNRSHLYSLGLAALLAVGAGSAPLHACVAPVPVTDTQVGALGTDLVPADTPQGQPKF